jgi:hypothetical protein
VHGFCHHWCKYKLSIKLVLRYVNLLLVDGTSLVTGQRNGHHSGLALLPLTVTISYSLIPRLELSRCVRYIIVLGPSANSFSLSGTIILGPVNNTWVLGSYNVKYVYIILCQRLDKSRKSEENPQLSKSIKMAGTIADMAG